MTLRCPQCRTRRATFASMQDHIRASGHSFCYCGGYHYPHRPTGGCCERNDWCTLRQAQRANASLEEQMDIAADLAWELRGREMKTWQ